MNNKKNGEAENMMKNLPSPPTWGEFGRLFYQFAISGHVSTVKELRPHYAEAFSIAQAFVAIQASLTKEQAEKAAAVFRDELK
jgi:hypothetical protein